MRAALRIVAILIAGLVSAGFACAPAKVLAASCAPLGGAPGPIKSVGDSGLGAIGPDASPIGGQSPSDFLADLIGASPEAPALSCEAPGAEGGSSLASGEPPFAKGAPPLEKGAPPFAAGSAATTSGGEPASLSVPAPGQAAGNPVDLITGNKYARRVDAVLPDPESGLETALRQALGEDAVRALGPAWHAFAPLRLAFTRHYNSRFEAAGPLGPGWRHGFETALARLKGPRGIELQIVQGDGRRIVFRRVDRASQKPGHGAASSRHEPARFSAEASDGHVDEDLDSSLPWSWRWPDGRLLRFDRDGRLDRIEAPDRDRIVLQRDRRGRLMRMSDAAGRSLRLEYRGARLAALVLPDGMRIAYGYDRHGVLDAVRYPDGRVVRHHYEDPQAFHLLTGIEAPDGSRSRYRYDDRRRVTASAPREGSSEGAIELEYRLPEPEGTAGETIVRESSRLSRWHWRIDPDTGIGRLTSFDGEPCTSCPVLGSRMRRSDPGILTVSTRTSKAAKSTSNVLKTMPPEILVKPMVGIRAEIQVDGFGLPTEARLHGRTASGGTRGDDSGGGGGGGGGGGAEPDAIHLRWHRHREGPLAGKLAWVERLAPDGTAARTVLRHDERRALVEVERPEGLVHRFERGPLGRAIVQHRADRARLEASFDRFWRLVGWRERGALIEITWNAAGLPAAISWPAGDRWALDWSGTGVEIESSRGWVARSGNDDRGVEYHRASGEREAAPTGDLSSPGAVPSAPTRGIAVALAFAQPNPVVVDAAGRRTERIHDDFGRLAEERSSVAGFRRFHYDPWGHLATIEAPTGVIERRRYDLAGRLIERDEIDDGERVSTRLHWQGALLVAVEHPAQQTRIEHDSEGRITAIEHRLLGRTHRWTFSRDSRGRVAAEGLPDGSRLLHRRDPGGRPIGLAFEPADGGLPMSIVDAVRYRGARPVSWRYGNGVRLEREGDAQGRLARLRWIGLDRLPDWRYRWQAGGLPSAIADRHGERRFGWDRLGRLIIQEKHLPGADAAEYFAWDLAGDLRFARRSDGSNASFEPGPPQRDVLGRPQRHGRLALHYGPQQRIVEVREPGAGESAPAIARYAYNAAGERTFKQTAAGKMGFLYRGRALAAETDADGEISRYYLRWLGKPVAVVDRERSGSRITWLHGDHLGTPHAATDAAGRPVWRAEYEAFGRISSEHGEFRQPLRFAGQYHDEETGLHDNYLRTYDPAAARYLEPDPMGLAGGLNPWAYADGNPLMGTDPLGLILFAFDGTMSGPEPTGQYEVSNVVKFFERYQDGKSWYMTGVGLDDLESGIKTNSTDMLNANTARARVDYMSGQLGAYLGAIQEPQVVDIDVIGFSRGAAMARDFVNGVSDTRLDWQQKGICLNLRFLGLWETVAQFGWNGSSNDQWRLGIPASVGAAYHAVALNEHRLLLPLEAATGPAVIERGFVGDHSDIGGGNAEGDLSDVALVWMMEMAQRTGLKLRQLADEYRTVTSPILHNRRIDRDSDRTTALTGNAADRSGEAHRRVDVRDTSGAITLRTWQRDLSFGGLDWINSLPFIIPLKGRRFDAEGRPSIVGSVDMAAYATWLSDQYEIEVKFHE